jgi:hypothetical protein
MSNPPVKAPAMVRWFSLLIVLVAVIVRFWPHGTTAPATPVTPASVPAARGVPGTGADTRTAASSVGFRSRERLEQHFQKHGGEFHAASAEEYLRLAQALRDRPAGGDVLELKRSDGVISRFDRASGAFLAFNADGTIRTFFRPNDGERYFERQASRPHGSP